MRPRRLTLSLRVLPLAVLVAASLACNAAAFAPTATPIPTATPLPTSTAEPGWEAAAPGLALRSVSIPVSSGGLIPATLVRVDPSLYTMRVHYDQTNPSTISAWQARTGAALVVNGGYFTPEYAPLGLLVADGQITGQSFDGFGGMLSTSGEGVSLRALSQEPYFGEPLDQAVQGRPVLLYPGGTPADFDFSTEPDRRTAVALDAEGRLVFIIVDRSAVSLYELRDWLAVQDVFDVTAALNLDGGGSTGMALAVEGRARLIDSWSTLPVVLAFYPAG